MDDLTLKPSLARRLVRPVLAGTMAAAAAVPAHAATVFLELHDDSGTLVAGESVDAKYKSFIEIQSYQQGFANNLATPAAGGHNGGKADCGSITVTKVVDKASPVLMRLVMTGKHADKGTFHFRSPITDKTQSVDYYTVTLDEVLVDGISQSSGGDRVSESVNLLAKRYHFSYRPQLATGGLGEARKFGFDCETLTPLPE